MRHLKQRLASICLVFGLVLTLSLGLAPRVSAAAAICIHNSKDRPVARVSCAGEAGALKLSGVSSPAANTCYYINYPPPSSTTGIYPTVSQAPNGSDLCKGWLKLATDVAGGSATCYKVKGANVNIGTYDQGNVPSDIVTKTKCKDNLLSQQPNNGSKINYFRPGACYLVFADHSIHPDSCSNIESELGTADSSDKVQSPPSSGPTGAQANPQLGPSAQQAEIQSHCKPNSIQECVQENPLIKDINAAINLLSALVGIIVVIMIIVGGIQYMTAGGNPQAVAAAKKRILNAVISLGALVFMYSLLQWLVPGGIF